MTDAELRALVRDAVARRLGGSSPANAPVAVSAPTQRVSSRVAFDHPSHDIYVTVVNGDGTCVIEPSVACDHCGYCKSHGH